MVALVAGGFLLLDGGADDSLAPASDPSTTLPAETLPVPSSTLLAPTTSVDATPTTLPTVDDDAAHGTNRGPDDRRPAPGRDHHRPGRHRSRTDDRDSDFSRRFDHVQLERIVARSAVDPAGRRVHGGDGGRHSDPDPRPVPRGR